MPAKLLCALVLLASLFPALSRAQNGTFTIAFAENNAAAGTGIIDAYAKIVNTSASAVEGVFETSNSSEDIYLVQQKPKTINLAAGDSIFIPVKAIVSTRASAGKESVIEAVFTRTDTQESKSVILPVTINLRKLVKMHLPESNLIYENRGDSLIIPIQLYNEGNTEQQITLAVRYPNSVLDETIETLLVNVRPFSDTLVNVKKEVSRSILNQDDFNISVTALYDSGDIVGLGTIRANSIRQDRRYTPNMAGGQNIFQNNNQISASYQFSNNDIATYFLYANAQAEINQGILYGSVDANYWVQSQETFIRNTWLGYKQKGYGVQAGNITYFEDLSLLGRGVQAFVQSGLNNKIEAGAVDKSFNLIDDSDTSLGKAGWATFTRNGGWASGGYNASVLYDHDTFAATQNILVSSRHSLVEGQNFRLKAGGAVSNIMSEVTGDNEIGGAGEVQISGKGANMFYSSNNYFSSGYYSGIRKGVLSFNERVQWTLGKYNVWGVLTNLSVNPKNFGREYFLTSKFSTSRYDIGISRQINSISISATPYYYTDSRTERLSGDVFPRKYNMYAARLALGVNYFNRPTGQNVNLSLEGGSFTTNVTAGSEMHFKTSLNYSWKMINVLMFYQHNYFYLGEIISGIHQDNDETYYNLSFTPTLQGQFFNKRLAVNAGVMYSKNSTFQEISQFIGRAEFKISDSFTVFGHAYYSDLKDIQYSVNTYQIGLTKTFNPIRIDRNKHDLEVYLYYDKTGKGPADTANIPAAGQIVIIGGKAFKTDSKGMIKYRALPEDTYEVRAVNTNDWHTPPRTVLISADTKLEIGLNKTGTVKGTLGYVSTDKSYEITKRVAGLSVVAIDESGTVFNTKTNDTGGYVLYLPKGNYTLSLEKSGISEYVEVQNNNIQVSVESNESVEADFILFVKEKKVETKKFTSRGFPTMSTDKKKKRK